MINKHKTHQNMTLKELESVSGGARFLGPLSPSGLLLQS